MTDARADFTNATLEQVEVRLHYATANERILAQLERHIERLTKDGKPARLLLEFDGSRFHIWEGVRAGVV